MNLRQFLNILGLIFALVMNYLANALPLNGISTGQISDNIPALFTPAGYVFAIWGVIYLALIAFTIYQALPAQKENPRLERIGYWFFLSNLLNGAWIYCWHYGMVALSVLVMLGLLFSLLMIYTRSGIGLVQSSARETWLLDVPFGIYLGWISVATIANIAALGVVSNWNGFGLTPVIWTVLVILVGLLLGVMMIRRRREIAYPLVLIWAFVGIYVAQSQNSQIAYAAIAAAAALFFYLLASLFNRQARKPA